MYKKPTKKEYESMLLNYAKSKTKPCATCGHIVINGYCCNYCGGDGSDKPNKKLLKNLKQES